MILLLMLGEVVGYSTAAYLIFLGLS